jgi:sugar phosphate permease
LLGCHLTAKEASEGLTLYNFGGIVGAIAVGWWISLKGSRLPMSLSAIFAIVSAGLIASPISRAQVSAVIGPTPGTVQ